MSLSRRALLASLPLAGFARAAWAGGAQAPKLDDATAPGFTRYVLARWGDAVLPDAPAFNPHPLTPDQAAGQFPYDSVIAGLVAPPPAQDGIARLVMALANPDAPARMVFPGGVDDPRTAGLLQGGTILNLQFQGGRWLTVDGGFQSRRLTDGTLCQMSGPAAGVLGGTVQGVIAPQAGCATPWGSVLLPEGDAAPWLTRLRDVGYGFDDPAAAPKFGWVVEVNPLDPGAFPAKRTALGRFSRAGIAAGLTPDGRPVVFMSQAARAGVLLRFIAATNATDGSALDSGTLSVAQIDGNQIDWVDLPGDIPALAGTIGAASAASGSALDSPAGLALAPDHTLYLACRGNAGRSIDDTNPLQPRAGDDNGYILVFRPPGGDLTSASFNGEIAIAAGNPATAPFTQYAQGTACWLKNPSTVNLDAGGALWIGTDQRGAVSDTADGLFVMQGAGYGLTNVYFAPLGAAIGGAGFHAASSTVFAMVRHPGATKNASFDAPATTWPSFAPGMPPQSTLIALARG
jgi:secreted PhoX family phosphatase